MGKKAEKVDEAFDVADNVTAIAEAPAADDGATEVAEKEPKMKKRVKGVTKESKITILTKENIKREGSASHTRFNGYFTDPAPTTVAEALDNGLTMGDIHYDFIHGFIDVEGVTVDTYLPSPRGPRVLSEDDAEVEVSEGEEADHF